MAKVTKHIGFLVEIDEGAIAPQSVNVFIYRLLNNLNNEHEIKIVTIDDVTLPITKSTDMYMLSLGEDKDQLEILKADSESQGVLDAKTLEQIVTE